MTPKTATKARRAPTAKKRRQEPRKPGDRATPGDVAATSGNVGGFPVAMVPITSVIPYARNPRKNAGAPVVKVAASIKEYGFRQPIVVDREGVIIAGHTRLLAALHLGLREVPVHVAEGLTPAQVKAYRLADNRVGQEATWDDALLGLELTDLQGLDFDMGLTGFGPEELEALLHPEQQGLQPGVDPDDAPEPPADPVTKAGDLITLGRHRLVCGDSTSPTDLALLMGSHKAEVLWTDPPYGVNYVGKTKRALQIQNDQAEDLTPVLSRALATADEHMEPGCRFYLASPPGSRATEIRVVLMEQGWPLHQALVWVKDVFVLGHSDYHYRHEDILYGWKPGEGRVGRGNHEGTRWCGDHSQDSVFEVARPKRSEQHPTMKPVELVTRCLQNSAKPGDVVLDIFGGSGSTMVACEAGGWIARLMEIDPAYCDVIVTRWEQATGQKAVRPPREG